MRLLSVSTTRSRKWRRRISGAKTQHAGPGTRVAPPLLSPDERRALLPPGVHERLSITLTGNTYFYKPPGDARPSSPSGGASPGSLPPAALCTPQAQSHRSDWLITVWGRGEAEAPSEVHHWQPAPPGISTPRTLVSVS